MAADDDKNDTPDPWADLVADDLGGEGNETSFSFVEKSVPEVPGESPFFSDVPVEPEAFVEPDAASDLAEQLEPAPPLSVFAPEEAVADPASPSSIEIGTGFSGIDMSAEGGDSNAATEGLEGWGGLEETDGEADPFAASLDTAEDAALAEPESGDVEEPTVSFAAAAPVAAAATLAAPRKTAAKPRAKGGGLGPMIGVMAGGVMAIPITMAILLWGFQRDPFGVAKQVPESMSFLLPQKFRPGFKKPAGGLSDLAAAPSLDDLAAATPSGDGAAPEAAQPAAEPAVEPGTEPASLDAAVAAVDPLAPAADTASTTELPKPEPEDPLFPDPDTPAATPDPLAAAGSAPTAALAESPAAVEPAPPALPPLDMAAFEAAVAEAATALEAAAAADNHAELPGKTLLVGWYKAVAHAADELVKLQNEAADSGRPLDAVPEQLAAVYESIAAEQKVAAALPLLARHWLSYARRDSEGILLPVTFDSAKKAGPYWRSKVMLEDGEHSRELVIISREEPAAVAGEPLLVTGVVFDGDVIWAAEVRPMPGEPATVDF